MPVTRAEEPTEELDAGELERAREEMAPACPIRHARVVWAARSEIGRVREHNEDKFDFYLSDSPETLARCGRLWAVADGMGGHNAGQIASETALRVIVREYYADSGADREAALQQAFVQANSLLFQAASRTAEQNGMGTTATVAVIRDDVLTIAHAGDSRAYLWRDGALRQLTTDHTWVEEQVRRGALTREEAQLSPYRNMLTRSIGMGNGFQADTFSEPLQAGDVLLLCSDGLTGMVDAATLEQRLQDPEPARAVLALVDAANRGGGRDNITALMLAVRSLSDWRDGIASGE